MPCRDMRRKPRRVRRRNPGEMQFGDLGYRDLLHAGRAGYLNCFGALNVGIKGVAKTPSPSFCQYFQPRIKSGGRLSRNPALRRGTGSGMESSNAAAGPLVRHAREG